MLKIKNFLIFSLILTGFTSPLFVYADEFDDAFNEMDIEVSNQYDTSLKAKEKKQTEFEQWKEQQQNEYNEYKRAYLEALNSYKSDILKHWDQVEITDKKNWVEYSDDMKTKRVVDFEKNEIRISIANSQTSDENIQKIIDNNLTKILSETPNGARKNDPVLKAVGSTKADTDKQSQQAILSSAFKDDTKTLSAKKALLKKEAVIKRPATTIATKKEEKPAVVVTIKLPENSLGRRAAKYESMVIENARKNKLDPTLVYAIMHTESAFNPMARSNVPAFGLMQIVPGSAGRDVAVRLLGEDKILSADYLYNAENNVEAGSTYLNILYYSYLKGITDPQSRLYCTIAAYNTGAGNIAKTFTGDRNLRNALSTINGMSSQQVYSTLINNLPYQETRDYLQRVVSRQKLYVNL